MVDKTHSQYKHGMASIKKRNIFYSKWSGMKRRCQNSNDRCFSRYGGRGVSVCKRWLGFKNFYTDMYASYKEHLAAHGGYETTLDRIDNNKGYSPKNCRWVTRAEQNKNKRNVKLYTFNGKTLNASDWDRELGVKSGTVRARIVMYKWPIEKALSEPKKIYKGFMIDQRGKYRVEVKRNGRTKFIGRFNTEKEALNARAKYLNPPRPTER